MSGKKLILFFFSIFILFSSVNIKSQEGDSLYYVDPDRRVAEMIFEKRVVMLADFAHHVPAPMHTVLCVLDKWLAMSCSADTSKENLILVLEMQNTTSDILKEYILTGDFSRVIDYQLPEAYMDVFEFWINLRKFKLKTDSVNTTRKYPIGFDIQGFEEVGHSTLETNPAFLSKSEYDAELWFVTERDSTTAIHMIQYINENPDSKVLAFYGGAHLMNGYVSKAGVVRSLRNEQTFGYYLVHYLKNEYGVDNVVTISQGWLEPYLLEKSKFRDVKDNEILIRNIDYPLDNFNHSFYDYYIFRNVINIPPRSFFYVFSKVIIEKSIEDLKKLEPFQTGFKSNNYRGFFLNNMWTLTGRKFTNMQDLEKWYKNSKYDGIARLDSKEFADTLFSLMKAGSGFRYFLHQLGWDQKILDDRYIPDMKKDWPYAIKHIKFINCLGIYWIGYPDEKIKAKEYLVKFSGEDFVEPEKYLQWYRMKYYGYEY